MTHKFYNNLIIQSIFLMFVHFEKLGEGVGACGEGVGRLGGSATGTAQDPAHLGCVLGRAQCQVAAL